MRAHNIGHGPGLAAPKAAASLCAAGAASVVADAVALAGLNAQKKSAPVSQATRSREQIEHRNSATFAGADKAFLTLRAVLALKGYSLLQLQDGSFLVSRWTSSKALADLSAVEQFLKKVSP